jgi:hypothetical protein
MNISQAISHCGSIVMSFVHTYCGQTCAKRRGGLWPRLWATVD